MSALIVAIKDLPRSITQFLNAINGLGIESRKVILTQTKFKGESALIFAIKEQPSAVPKLLEAINWLDDESKKVILTQTDWNGSNALMCAIHYRPSAVPELLKATNGLDNESKKVILAQTNDDGLNALMIAIKREPGAVPKLLEVINGLDENSKNSVLATVGYKSYHFQHLSSSVKKINELDDESRRLILTQVDSNNSNAFSIGFLTAFWEALSSHQFSIQQKKNIAYRFFDDINLLGGKLNGALLTQTLYDHPSGENLNALMMVSRYPFEEAPKFFEAINQLDDESKKSILIQTDSCGSNALMIATTYQPSALPELLNAIHRLDDKSKNDILTQTDKYGSNALMLALKHRDDKAYKAVFKAINGLDNESKNGILTQIDSNGSNALMITIKDQPGALPELLETIHGLDKVSKKDILTKVSCHINDTFKVAIENKPHAAPELLKIVNRLDDESKRYTLTQIDSIRSYHFSSVLAIAISHKSEAAPEFLNAIHRLDDKSKNGILTQIDSNGSNALMITIKDQPGVLPELLEVIRWLDEASKKDILTKVGCHISDILKIAIKDQPSVLPKLFYAINRLDEESKKSILTQIDSHGSNALMIARISAPQILPKLLKAIYINQVSMLTPYLKPILSGCWDNAKYRSLLMQFFWYVVGRQPSAVPELLNIINYNPYYKYSLSWFSIYNRDWNTALKIAVQYQASELPELLNTINDVFKDKDTVKDTINCALESSQLEQLTHSQLIDILKSIKDSKYAKLFIKKILPYKDKFNPEDWYTIAKNELLSVELIDEQKTNIYTYLVSENNLHRKEDIAEAINIDTGLGKFFQLKYGFFSSSLDKEILKKIKAQAVGSIDEAKNPLISGLNL